MSISVEDIDMAVFFGSQSVSELAETYQAVKNQQQLEGEVSLEEELRELERLYSKVSADVAKYCYTALGEAK